MSKVIQPRSVLRSTLACGFAVGFSIGTAHWIIRGFKPFPILTTVFLSLILSASLGATAWILMKAVRRRIHGQPNPGSPVAEGPANHVGRWTAQGGYLRLTQDQLTFFSHGLNLRNQDVSLALNKVHTVTPGQMWGLIPNVVQVEMTDGTRHRFVVTNRQEWMVEINRARDLHKAA